MRAWRKARRATSRRLPGCPSGRPSTSRRTGRSRSGRCSRTWCQWRPRSRRLGWCGEPLFQPRLPIRIGNQYFVTNGITGAGNYYRLVKTFVTLSAVRVGPSIVVSWPATSPLPGTLKATANLAAPIVWNPVGIDPTFDGTNYYVTNLFVDGAQFYRLFY